MTIHMGVLICIFSQEIIVKKIKMSPERQKFSQKPTLNFEISSTVGKSASRGLIFLTCSGSHHPQHGARPAGSGSQWVPGGPAVPGWRSPTTCHHLAQGGQ